MLNITIINTLLGVLYIAVYNVPVMIYIQIYYDENMKMLHESNSKVNILTSVKEQR